MHHCGASMEAGIVTAVEMLGAKEPQTNTLTAMGDAVSREVRRLLLLEVLEKNHWNLSKTAIDLRITAGAPASVLGFVHQEVPCT